MFDNKYFIDLYVLFLDKRFEIFVPVDEKVGNIISLVKNSLNEFHFSTDYNVLLNLYSGQIYNANDIIRNTDIKNGTKLMLV